ncbi:MAG TPA: glycoside hydrolase family 57 protein [Bacteroidales bacterium]|nr:glycoside hydrolase family 57 protein [Bacteroidales bacterium]
MRTICLYFQIHQPFRLKRYRFFDIGNDDYYYDDYSNDSILQRVTQRSYLKANKILGHLIKEYKENFKVTFSISGTAINQFELYAPQVLESLKQLSKTGNVEFLSEPDAHSLASLIHRDEFEKQVAAHRLKIQKYFNQTPTIFKNTELIYSDDLANQIVDMGFEGTITEGAKQILGWKSPNYLYCSAVNPRLKLLLRNFKLSDDLSFRFSNRAWNEFPLTTEKFAYWLNHVDSREENINIFVDYETFGGRQPEESGIFEFLKHLPGTVLKSTNYTFSTPSEVIKNLQPVAAVSVPNPISWADEERDITAWLGNDLQKEAFHKLYQLKEQIDQCQDRRILTDWKYLQTSDHFHYMSTKFFSDRPTYAYVNPFESPYDAFINYMNVLSDFALRVKQKTAVNNTTDDQTQNLMKLLDEKDQIIAQYEVQLSKLQKPAETKTAKNAKPKTTQTKKTKATTTTKKTSEKKNELIKVM